jgi:hypothetical protein
LEGGKAWKRGDWEGRRLVALRRAAPPRETVHSFDTHAAQGATDVAQGDETSPSQSYRLHAIFPAFLIISWSPDFLL